MLECDGTRVLPSERVDDAPQRAAALVTGQGPQFAIDLVVV
jgi:hypothetical protein